MSKTKVQKEKNMTPQPKKNNKTINLIVNFFTKPANVILFIFAIFLTIMVIYPLIELLISSFTVHTYSEAKMLSEEWNVDLASVWSTANKSGKFTFLSWPSLLFPKSDELRRYSAEKFWTPLGNSVLMSLLACTIAVLSGGILAWLITRSNMPFKKFVSVVFIFPYIMPSWSIAMFWENFFKNTSVEASPGIGLLQSLTGLQAPEWMVYGLLPTALTLGIHYAPFAYILIGGILRNMDANLEEAATILKASRWKIITRITLPIVAPAMVSTILLVFSSSLSTYTVPMKLHFDSISTQLRGALSSTNYRTFGYIMAVILLIFSILILSINNAYTRSRKNFTTVSGKSGQVTKTNLKKAKWPITAVVLVIVSFFAIVPLLSFVLESLEENSGDLSSLTLKYWFSTEEFDSFLASKSLSTKGVFHNYTIWQSFGRSIIVAIIVSLLAGTFGILIGYAVSKKRKSKLANYVSSVAFLPYLIPALSFSAVFYALIHIPAFSLLDISTTQSEISAIAICVIVGCVKFLPFASRSGTNAMLQLSGEIEEAAIITGCPWIKRMTKILFPIQKSSFISGYLLPFISCMREYTLFILLTGATSLITNTLQYYSTNGLGQLSNAINLLIVVFVIVANFLVNSLTGASIDKGIGG